MTNADLIIRLLRQAGVTHAFGIPSGNTIPLLEAARTGGIEFVLMAHEGSAGFAAEVMARLTGKPGFCFATMGPGATNLTTGVGCAYLDRSPVVALTCTVPTHQAGRRVQMAVNHVELFRPVTKASCRLRAGHVGNDLLQALSTALGEPPGPVHLEVPEDLLLAEATGFEPALPPAGLRLRRAPEVDIERLAARVSQVERPLVVIGASARRLREPGALEPLIDHLQLPFATTTMAKGVVDESHPLSVGCIERGRRQLQRAFLRSADLIVAIGYDVAEVEIEQWIGQVPLVSLGVEQMAVDRSVLVEQEAVGDLDASIRWWLRQPAKPRAWAQAAARTQRQAFQAALRPLTTTFAPHQAIDVARRVLPRDGVLAFDVGAHTHQVAGQWTAHAPGTFLVTNAWSSMGFALPAAIAAKLARPDLPVLCLLGDGCFQMTCGEVAAARRLGLRLPIVVLNDGWLSLIELKQSKKGLNPYGTSLQPGAGSDRAAPAPPEPPEHYFGVPAVGVHDADAFERALTAAFEANGPTVIEAFIDPAGYRETVFD